MKIIINNDNCYISWYQYVLSNTSQVITNEGFYHIAPAIWNSMFKVWRRVVGIDDTSRRVIKERIGRTLSCLHTSSSTFSSWSNEGYNGLVRIWSTQICSTVVLNQTKCLSVRSTLIFTKDYVQFQWYHEQDAHWHRHL